MGYNIEISFNILKHNNVTEMKKQIADFALDHNCSYYYYLHEYEDRIKFPRNHCIMVIHFDDEEESCVFNCAIFLRQVRKMKDLFIECIYDDEIVCHLIYASHYYLKNVEKDKAIKYSKFKKERSYSEEERIILSSFDKNGSGVVVSSVV